jgi:outer membrane lipoprotein
LRRKAWFILGVVGLMFSCAPLSKEIMSQVDETLTYQAVHADPLKYVGKTVLWGGVIIETVNKQGETVVKVRQTELDIEKRPINLDHSAGRFIVQSAGFLDPAIYQEGREITAAGVIAGQETLPLGNTHYSYPVIQAKEIHLWEKRAPLRYDDPWYWGYPYGWYPYWGYPNWRYRPYYW